jgi:hypothetical protein
VNTILYPINSVHTGPLVRGVARATAKFHATTDVINDVTLTIRQVHNEAKRAFKAFCEGQPQETLTDDYTALQLLYMSAYVDTYYNHYSKLLDDLEAMVEEDVKVEQILNVDGLECLDNF